MAYLTGFHAIEERIKAGYGETLLVGKAGPRAREIVALAMQHKVRTERTGAAELDRLASDNRGVILVVSDSNEESGTLESFLLEACNKKDAVVVILDEVTDPHNYGAILRSADQFGVDAVLTRKRRIAGSTDVVERSSAGAAAWVRQIQVANLARALEQLKEAGFWIYGADMKGEALFKKDLRGKTAFVFGGEAGLSQGLRKVCDGMISIPSKGRVDSLNVSCAAGVILYEASRQRLC